MKQRTLLSILALLVVVSLGLAACGTKTAAPEPTKEQVAAPAVTTAKPVDTAPPEATKVAPTAVPPTNTPGPTKPEPTKVEPTAVPPTETAEGTPESDPGIAAVTSGIPEDVNSYRSTMKVEIEGKTADGTAVSQSFSMSVEWVREPPAQHVTLAGNWPGTEQLTGGAADGTIEMYSLEGTLYMQFMGSWLAVPADESTEQMSTTGFLTSKEMLDELKDAKYEGKEEINGVMTRHYSFDETNFDASKLTGGQRIKRAEGNVYVAVEGEYVVHMDVDMEGTKLGVPAGEEGQEVEEGTMSVVLDMTDVNAQIEIAVPPEALAASKGPEDIPIPDDAEDVQYVGMMGMTTFSSGKTPQEVADWYKAEMPKVGWTAGEVSEMSGFVTMDFTKDTRKASFMISTDSSSGKTSVLISVAEQ